MQFHKLVLVSAALIAQPAFAQRLSDTFSLQVSAYFPNVDSSVRVDGSDGNLGTEIDFERDLGYDRNRVLPAFMAEWRPNDDWVLNAEYYAIGRRNQTFIDRELVVGDTVFPVDAELNSGFDSDIGLAKDVDMTKANAKQTRLETRDDRRAAGKALRVKTPREAHGKVILGQGNGRDIVELIRAQNEDRLENLIPVRHGRMSQSAFAFFRGTAGLQAHDLSGTPHSGIIVQACGDCHLMNFGGFATPERNIVFDINDFDETLPAPFEWDVKRLAASFVVAARWRGFKADDARRITVRMVRAYRESMLERADFGVLESWYSRMTIDDVRKMVSEDPDDVARIDEVEESARKRTHENVFAKLVSTEGGRARIVDEPPLIYHPDDQVTTRKVISKFLSEYRDTLPEERRMLYDRFRFIDLALKVVGVGSVGTRCFIALFLADPDDPLFLQVKEARQSVLEPYVPKMKGGANIPGHNGHRVVLGQRLMQAASDIFLGWATGSVAGREFYVRQLRDMKIAPVVESQSPTTMRHYARLCGMALARAHDKAGDAASIAGYLGKSDAFDEAIGDYAEGYADQVERDYAAFVSAIRSGKLTSDTMPGAMETMLR